MIPILAPDPESPFPPTDQALDYPEGLLAIGGDLSPARLINAYRQGIFPWYSDDQPILWWSPSPRCVIFPGAVHVSRRLRRRYNQGQFSLTADQSFAAVIAACAEPRADQDGTWITDDMRRAYIRLHRLGVAHSVEVHVGGELVGGIYGLALGGMFFGESMFSRQADASKLALVGLCRQLHQWGFSLLDCQVSNPHLLSMGAQEISRQEFNQHLKTASEPDHWGPAFYCAKRW
ncbi:MAG TPA: leucyl/phenylalanyl-tRNA--protein transferase [Xanthomonadales bacterium]